MKMDEKRPFYGQIALFLCPCLTKLKKVPQKRVYVGIFS